MDFGVGPFTYRLAISDRSIFDAEGNELEGCAVEARRLLIISRIVEPERREEIALHEFTHAWGFHVPKPSDEEERCQLTALIAQQFAADLERAGGREALQRLPAQRVPHLGKPARSKAEQVDTEQSNRSDRRVCGGCGAEVMCGSVVNGDIELHGATNRTRMGRWMECEACGALQHWTEYCTADGIPLGEYVSNPPPRVLYGAQAAAWMAERRELAGA